MTLAERLRGSPYQSYLYGYPHKTAYRPFAPRQLADVWKDEPREGLFLYVHIPFCEMRCGFCNLFTAAGPQAGVVDAFLAALTREAAAVRSSLGPLKFSRLAVGGGTPSFLEPHELEKVFGLMASLGAQLGELPMSVELSPETTTLQKVKVLRAAGADRVSLGVQSFLDTEVAAVKRPQERHVVQRALDALRTERFNTLNIDLIYGIEGQTEASFLQSIRTALTWAPEELYLYPLYVRPLTGLGKSARAWDDQRVGLYRAGREFLLAQGYRQSSMRMFQKAGPRAAAPPYRCQEDGMIGLGPGARSYTRALHYSWEFAVASRAVRGIIDAYNTRDQDSFGAAHHGYQLSVAEQERRFSILSLLSDEGLSESDFSVRFGRHVLTAVPELSELLPLELAAVANGRWTLTADGVERSDVIGPWLHSRQVDALMNEWDAR